MQRLFFTAILSGRLYSKIYVLTAVPLRLEITFSFNLKEIVFSIIKTDIKLIKCIVNHIFTRLSYLVITLKYVGVKN